MWKYQPGRNCGLRVVAFQNSPQPGRGLNHQLHADNDDNYIKDYKDDDDDNINDDYDDDYDDEYGDSDDY